MRTVTFGSVLDGVAQRAVGQLSATLPTGGVGSLITYIADRVRTAWEFYRWPETMGLEGRYYYAAYDNAHTYATADIVYYAATDTYYSALGATTGHLPTDTNYWTPAANFHKSISYTQPGQTVFDTVTNAWDKDPRADDTAKGVPFTITNEGVSFDQHAPNKVWLEFRAPAPAFDAVVWDSGTVYYAGQTVYYAGNGLAECYLINTTTSAGDTPVSAAAKFTLIPFPMILARAVKWGALADYYRADGKDEKAAGFEGTEGDGTVSTYFGALEEQVRQLVLLQGQRGRWLFQPPPTVQSGPGCIPDSMIP